MEAHISHQRLDAMFRNIRFVYNALARRFHHPYDLVEARGNHFVLRASGVTAGTFANLCFYGIAQFGGFDGPFVALFPAAVHSPRCDDICHRERGEI